MRSVTNTLRESPRARHPAPAGPKSRIEDRLARRWPTSPSAPGTPLRRISQQHSVLVVWILSSLIAAFAVAQQTEQSPVPPEIARHVKSDAPRIALTGVHILDGTGSPAAKDQTLVVRDGRIAAVGPAATTPIPDGAEVLSLPGRTVIPGLVGMHNHTHMPGAPELFFSTARLELAAGVTTIQTAGSAAAEQEIRLAGAIASGSALGPRIVPSAPYITGPGGNTVMTQPANPQAAVEFVEHWARAGAKWFKLYRHTTPEIARAVIEAAHRLGAGVTAHPCSLTFGELAELGIDRIEHGLLSITDFHTPRKPGSCPTDRLEQLAELDLDSPEVKGLIETLVQRGVALTSTLAIAESHFAHRPQADERSLKALSPSRVRAYHRRQEDLRNGRSTIPPKLFQKLLAFDVAFARAGGLLVAGPDTGRHVLPGFGDQRNFELLIEAGLDTPEVVKIMTSNGASSLGLEGEIGRIAPGLQADLVVLRGDLEADPKVIRAVEYTFLGGRAFDPASLLKEVEGRVGDL